MNHLTVQWSGHDSHSGSSLVIHLTVCCPFSLALMSDANDDDDVSLSRAVYVEPKPKVHPKPSCALERTPERTPEPVTHTHTLEPVGATCKAAPGLGATYKAAPPRPKPKPPGTGSLATRERHARKRHAK